MLNYLGLPCTCADEYGVMDPKRLEAKASLSREKIWTLWGHGVIHHFWFWRLASGSQGSQTQRPWEVCLCQPWSKCWSNWSCQVAKKRWWSLSSQAIIATNGKYKALICAALPSCSWKNMCPFWMQEPRRTRLRCKDVVQKNVDQKQNHEGLTLTPDNIMTHFPPSIWPSKYGNALNCWNLENSHLQKDPRHLFWEPVQQQATSSIVSLHVGSAMDKSWPKLYLSCNLTDPFLYIQGENWYNVVSSKSFGLEWHLTTPSLFSMALMLTRIANHVMVVQAPWHSSKDKRHMLENVPW